MDDGERQEEFGVLIEEIGDAFDEIVSKAEYLIMLADGKPALRHEATELLGGLPRIGLILQAGEWRQETPPQGTAAAMPRNPRKPMAGE